MDSQIEEMRRQMDALKRKLEQQEIVNDRLIRTTMKRNVGSLNRRYFYTSVVCLVMIPYSYVGFVRLNGMSLGFWAITCVMMLVTFFYTLFIGRNLRSKQLLSDDLVVAGSKIARAKRLDNHWLKFGLPVGLLWLAYFCYESYSTRMGESREAFVVIVAVCGLVGLVVGLKIHLRTQRYYRDILEQINELTA